jgi:UDP-N-acetylmuramyl pentapeptide phosphotransferase/UDP-N-acetylglucosamine-1-phosphate transferase
MSIAPGWPLSGATTFIIMVAAAILCAVLILALRPFLRRYALARPNARSSHREPTPQGGGIAVIAAAMVVTLLTVLAFHELRSAALAVVFAASSLIALVGAVDDIRPLPVIPRLLLQTFAVSLTIAAVPADLRIAEFLPWWIERLTLLIAGLWFVNLVNFMDGLDWMTVAEVIPVTAALILIGIEAVLPPYAVLVALALAGAMLGFAPFNRPVARLFLGDVGSLPIGLLLGWLLVLLAGSGHVAAALLLPLYYLADASITLTRRLLAGERIWEAHRRHFYQRATACGFTVYEVISRVFTVNFLLAVMAITSVLMGSELVSTVAVALGAVLVAMLLWTFHRGKNAAAA